MKKKNIKIKKLNFELKFTGKKAEAIDILSELLKDALKLKPQKTKANPNRVDLSDCNEHLNRPLWQ